MNKAQEVIMFWEGDTYEKTTSIFNNCPPEIRADVLHTQLKFIVYDYMINVDGSFESGVFIAEHLNDVLNSDTLEKALDVFKKIFDCLYDSYDSKKLIGYV